MRTLEELRAFYRETLTPKLMVLENQRKQVARKIYSICIPIFIIGAIAALSLGGEPAQWIIIVTIMILGIVYWFCTKGYVSDFKDTIIAQIVHFIDDSLTYNKKGYIPVEEFRNSEIFKNRTDRYSGDDCVSGQVGATKINFSEVHAQYRSTDSKGRSHYRTFFKGLFFIADFNKHFRGKTYVLPDTAEKMLGGFGAMFQKMNVGRPELVKLEDPQFEKAFVVYGQDQVEARYILSTSLMKRIVDFKEKSKRKIYLSFIRSKVYIALWYSRNLFEPRVFQTLLDFSPIQQYFEDPL